MDTKIKSASVKVMLSYDYSHFEASMSLETVLAVAFFVNNFIIIKYENISSL